MQRNLTLKPGHDYKLSFNAVSSVLKATEITFLNNPNDSTWDWLAGTQTVIGTAEEPVEYDFTSGRINTQDKNTFKYGYFECSARVPKGMGYLPAFWLMANDEQTCQSGNRLAGFYSVWKEISGSFVCFIVLRYDDKTTNFNLQTDGNSCIILLVRWPSGSVG